MPYYDFKCNVCNRPFETKCSWQDLDKVECPHCESPNVSRVYSSVGVLKGTPACADGCPAASSIRCEPGAST